MFAVNNQSDNYDFLQIFETINLCWFMFVITHYYNLEQRQEVIRITRKLVGTFQTYKSLEKNITSSSQGLKSVTFKFFKFV